MVSTPTSYAGNPFQPGIAADAQLPDLVVGGNQKLVTANKTITGGMSYRRGTVMGRIATGPKAGAFTIATSAATDGSQVPYAILADDTFAFDGDVSSSVYMQGEFYANAIYYGQGITRSIAEDALVRRGIFLKSSVSGDQPL